jgi:chorismate dehydratase
LRAKLKHLGKIRVGAVNYLNTKPMLYGITRHAVMDQIELIVDYPSKLASMLSEGQIDVGLIPVAATMGMEEWHIAGDYCIGADGAVATVCIFSEVPMDEITTVLLDYQSKTSVALARILLKEYWKKEVVFINASNEDFRKDIRGTTAGVVIGDRAFEQRLVSKYIYDLATAWKHHTGLPFVFAAWISKKPLPESFLKSFNEANALGVNDIAGVISEIDFELFNLEDYYKRFISFNMDEKKLKGLHLFLEKLALIKK